jgi:hypothetical protein
MKLWKKKTYPTFLPAPWTTHTKNNKIKIKVSAGL